MSANKRILVLSSDAGFGHRRAAEAVTAALEERYGQNCSVAIVNPLNERRVPGLLRRTQEGYDRIIRDWPELYRLGYEANERAITSVLVESSLAVFLYEGMRLLLGNYKPDAIVVTFPLYQPPLYAYFSLKNRQIPTVTVVTDLVSVPRMWFHRVADAFVVPTEALAALARKHSIKANRIKVVGIPVHPQFAHKPANRAELRHSLGWQPDLTTVLAIGSKRVERLAHFLRPLNHSGLPFQLAVIAGGDDDLHQELQATNWHQPTHVYNYVDNMSTLMHASDCVICKAGGLTVTESLACGLPMLLVGAIPGQETGNAQFVIESGAGELVEKPLLLLETLYHWLMADGRLLRERAQNARALSRPQAAYDIADLVWQAAERGPYRKHRLLGSLRRPPET